MTPNVPVSESSTDSGGRALRLSGTAVAQVIGPLQSGYQRDDAWAVAAVARLRREAGRDAYGSPTAWGLHHLEVLAELRERQRTTEPEGPGAGKAAAAYFRSGPYVHQKDQELREDTAVHLAVTLWALHQQSLRDEPMHLAGWPLGRSVRRLAHGKSGTHDGRPAAAGDADTAADTRGSAPERVEDVSEAVRKRFVRIGSASDTEVLATRLREMVQLLRRARIPLDYARLADQLVRWQDENTRDDVRRQWGRDFHRRHGDSASARTGDEGTETGVDEVPAGDFEADDADS
ncbi:type I-E CRISPR-associated protein Cse2/CasB [Streptomyces palmae]|uniref:Type I-E CRISPR-associated protein Cse2/CasB n=1 Tax=Streptomyces palmae TaxID=1701085 RepID=A0A4Z0HIJ5_9ACTN|nr:type I-E CRISPR-associated protein Cse2/CasB [Streptomyces palmae]TGB17809.1 type I-E CRISPR-associated protein Cse2/CasB [Streptomyces palmae]